MAGVAAVGRCRGGAPGGRGHRAARECDDTGRRTAGRAERRRAGREGRDRGHLPTVLLPRVGLAGGDRLRHRGDPGGRRAGRVAPGVRGDAVGRDLPRARRRADRRDRQPGVMERGAGREVRPVRALHLVRGRDRHPGRRGRHHHARRPCGPYDGTVRHQQLGPGRPRRRGEGRDGRGLRPGGRPAPAGPRRRHPQRQHRGPRLPRQHRLRRRQDRRRRRGPGDRAGPRLPAGRPGPARRGERRARRTGR